MKRIRGGSGLGDSLYLRPICDQFAKLGPVTALSDYPDVFIGSGIKVEPFRRHSFDVVAHYVGGKNQPATSIWDDVCESAGVKTELRFNWVVRNEELVRDLRGWADGRPFILAHGGREPMGRKDKFGRELLPTREAFAATLAALSDCFIVGIGKDEPIYPLSVHKDLHGKTSVSDLLDLAASCDGIVGQCSFAIPLAEIFDKPFLGVWASSGLASREPFIRTITPQKMLTKLSSRYVMDDWPQAQIIEMARAAILHEAVA